MEFYQVGKNELSAGHGESLDPSQAGSESVSFQTEALSEACPLLEAAAWTPRGGGEGANTGEKKIDLLKSIISGS